MEPGHLLCDLDTMRKAPKDQGSSGDLKMYYVPDGTQLAGYYECKSCHERFLDVSVAPKLVCPYCGKDPDMEIGPGDDMPKANEDTILNENVEGENVEKYDTLLSLAITGGDYSWICTDITDPTYKPLQNPLPTPV